jgi:cellulose synthase/poly-beta-1,6-N-acetylglucosamine synthase-like glycosyltransferase
MVYFYIALSIFLISSYVFLLLFILYKWQQPQRRNSVSKNKADSSYSILIPVRNEEKNILHCLNSILSNKDFDLSKLEIIVIDDHSEDKTFDVVQSLNHSSIKLLSLKEHQESNPSSQKTNAFKKAALNLGLHHAKGDYIIQFDGDVLVPEIYFKTVDAFIKKTQPSFVAAPVVFDTDNSMFQEFQVLDFLGMMLVTQAGIESQLWYMANGANMIYKKNQITFDTSDRASGDDVFGIQSIAKKNKQDIHFLKAIDATVETKSSVTLKEFISQRLRWSTKNKQMGPVMTLMMAIPFFNALMIPIHFVCMYNFGMIAFVVFLSHLTIKIMIDYIYLKAAAQFFKKSIAMKHFSTSFFLHFLYLGIIGVMSMFVRRYSWKGRKVY